MHPKLITIGDFFLPTYGVLVALAFLAGLWVAARLAKRTGLNANDVTNLGVYCALAGLAGAKLLMFVFDWRYFANNPREIFSLSNLQAGGVFQGGLICQADSILALGPDAELEAQAGDAQVIDAGGRILTPATPSNMPRGR